ncbi:uncharacterized protein LOC6507537 [Drosophila ananassae]|nr:uncharacterized protein LOC6507537 [Drosophila ananassae]
MTPWPQHVLILACLTFAMEVAEVPPPRGSREADYSCPGGYSFDDNVDLCVSENSTECTNYQISRCPTSVTVEEYCLCWNKHLQIHACPEGTHFDASHSVCRIGAAQCQDEFTPFACPNGSARNVFCQCIGGKYVTQTCPDGYSFDTERKFCFPANKGESEDSENGTKTCQRYGLFADPADCSGYYHCSDKGAEIKHFTCLGGTIFSLTSFACVPGSC